MLRGRNGERRPLTYWRAAHSLAALLLVGSTPGLLADIEPSPASSPSTDPREWLSEVSLLITPKERSAFLSLRRDYQRRAFIDRFWTVRDPHPETRLNEFRETWDRRLELARERFGSLDHDRAATLLLLGPPDRISTPSCAELFRPLEVWSYNRGETLPGGAVLVFVARSGRSVSAFQHWPPGEGLPSLLAWTVRAPEGREALRSEIVRRCGGGRELLAVLEAAVDWYWLQSQTAVVPTPPDEWVDAFLDRSTDLPIDVEILPAELRFEFPGRHQSRTVVQGLITVPIAAAVASDGDSPMFGFLIDGEILREDRLFDSFRYRFEIPASEVHGDRIPLVIQRYLRPGDYTLILELEDLHTRRAARSEQPLSVPVSPRVRSDPESTPAATDRAAARAADELAEANAVLDAGDHVVRILPPPEGLLTGRLRVEARASGEGIAKVAFALDGRPVMSKNRPPFSVEIDLGSAPRLHTLEALALDEADRVLARDRVPINAGPHRFSVRLLEPQPGRRYVQSLRAVAEVALPAGEQLDRVDFFLNESRLASLYQPPFAQPVVLPENERITYVRAVAHLADGNATEDIVFINSPPPMEHLRINMVELFTTVSDRNGRPVEGLERSQFTVLEEGQEQRIARFERVEDLSIHAAIVLDSSTSMQEELDEAVKAALRFFDRVLRSKDRASVVVFNDAPTLEVPFTNDIEVLAGGLADIDAEGETALYDTLVYTLYYCAGIRGKRALILLSDGQDSHSRHSLEDTLDFARRSGVSIYSIGLGVSHREMQVRSLLLQLARETGGRSFFIQSARELDSIYASIEQELRSQYLLAFQSSHEQGGPFRRIEVRVDQPGLEARTIPGYYP